MYLRIPPLVFRLALLVAVGVSTALLIDYLRPLPAFCDIGSGCDQVRASAYSRPFGIPLPLLGIAGFGGIMALSWSRKPWAPRVVRILSIGGGIGGALLFLTQAFALQVFCRLCLAVDCAAIVAGLCSAFFGVPRAPAVAASQDPHPFLWPITTAMALVIPIAWSFLQPSPPVPPEIAALWVPGKINVVEFADFQCPFCRKLHPAMAQLLDEYEGRVHFVRLNMPLAQHSQARTAARAYCCAEDQGQGTPMANALFQADNLSPEACEKIAASLGLSLDQYRACVKSAATEARIEDQMKRVRAAGLGGLPTVWIGSEVIVGLQPADTLSAAFAKAAGSKQRRLPTALLWVAFGAGLAAVAAVALRRSSRSPTLQ
jgi:predicted DsbA family dithiol-disulfide isomerase/uncharacterized membrane protein